MYNIFELSLIMAMLVYLAYISWYDIKTRSAPTYIHIIALFTVSLISTFQLLLNGEPMAIVESLWKGALIGTIFTVTTILLFETSPDKEAVMYTLPIFVLLSYSITSLIPSHDMIISIFLITPGIFIWDVVNYKKQELFQKIQIPGFVWIAVYFCSIIVMYAVFTSHMSEPYSRMFVFINFLIPLGMQKTHYGYGNGDVLTLWIITVFLMLLDFNMLAGYGALLYASLAYIVFVIIRISYYTWSDNREIFKLFNKVALKIMGIAVIMMIGLYKFTRFTSMFLKENTSGITLILSVFIILIVSMFIVKTIFEKVILNREKENFDYIQKYLDEVPKLQTEPFVIELTTGFILTILIGTPAHLVIKYLGVPAVMG